MTQLCQGKADWFNAVVTEILTRLILHKKTITRSKDAHLTDNSSETVHLSAKAGAPYELFFMIYRTSAKLIAKIDV
jgi:hypothetical protein